MSEFHAEGDTIGARLGHLAIDKARDFLHVILDWCVEPVGDVLHPQRDGIAPVVGLKPGLAIDQGAAILSSRHTVDQVVVIIGDMGDIDKGGEGPEVPALPRSSTFASGAAMEGCELSGSSILQSRR